jgi:hypothetical protein
MIKKIKNNSSEAKVWCGQEIQPSEYYEIQAMEETRWANDSSLLIDISNSIAIVNNGTDDISDINTAIDYLKNNLPIKIENSDKPIITSNGAPQNSDCMEPWGCEKTYFAANTQNFEITLSNKNGNTFDYVCSQPLAIGDYVFQDYYSKRSWVKEFTGTTVTFSDERPVLLENGVGRYVIGHYLDVLVVDWKPVMYLWGLFFNARNAGYDDFIEFSVVDYADIFAGYPDEALESMGFEKNNEYLNINGNPAWTKYYDEQWSANLKVGYEDKPGVGSFVPTPDGAPGELAPGLYLRISYFTSHEASEVTHFYLDYSPTSK